MDGQARFIKDCIHRLHRVKTHIEGLGHWKVRVKIRQRSSGNNG